MIDAVFSFILEHLVNYLKQVGATVPTMPLFYYHIPMRTGVNCELIIIHTTRQQGLRGRSMDYQSQGVARVDLVPHTDWMKLSVVNSSNTDRPVICTA